MSKAHKLIWKQIKIPLECCKIHTLEKTISMVNTIFLLKPLDRYRKCQYTRNSSLRKSFFIFTIPGLKNGPSTSCWKSLKSQTNSTLSQQKTVEKNARKNQRFQKCRSTLKQELKSNLLMVSFTRI